VLGVLYTISVVSFFRVDETPESDYSKLNLPRAPASLFPTAPSAFDSGNAVADRVSHALVHGFFALRPESSSNLLLVVFFGLLCIFLYFSYIFCFSCIL
jgi:hypothetical protein